MRYLLLIGWCLLGLPAVQAQDFGVDLNKEKELYRATKQVNQFFHRFNAEEDPKGERLYEGDPDFHNAEFRKKYLDLLFHTSVDKNLKAEFITDVIKKNQYYLVFHKTGWFAEVKTKVSYHGRPEVLTLFLSLQEELVGSKWVITNMYNASIYHLFDVDTVVWNKFIHPMSHELDFMNLNKVFQDGDLVPYLKRDFQPDYLTILAYEHKLGNLDFQTVSDVKFHFLQIPGWYFEIRNIQGSVTTGWMITKLLKIADTDKEAYSKLIFRDQDM
jgi:hypothetical protein